MGSSAKCTLLRQDPLSRKLPKLSSRGDQLNKIQQNSQELCSDCKIMTCIKGMSDREERRKGTEAIFEAIMIDNFPQINDTPKHMPSNAF